MSRRIARAFLALFFVAAGVNHFVRPALYLSIMPAGLPWPRALVQISGVAEILGGVGAAIPQVRRPAGWGLILLLLAVFPANVEGARHGMTVSGFVVPRWLLYLRLPLQTVLMAWVYFSCIGRNVADKTDEN